MNLERLYSKLNKIEVKYSSENDMKEILREIQTEILCAGKVNRGIVSNFKKYAKNDIRPVFSQIFESERGNYCVTNGFSIIDWGKSKENIPKELYAYINILEKYVKPTLDYETLKNQEKSLNEYTIKIKDLEKISKYNKIHKDSLLAYNFDNMLINADYLLQMLAIINYKKEEIKVKYCGQDKPLNIELDNCNMILLPIRHNDNETTYNNMVEKCKEILGIGE